MKRYCIYIFLMLNILLSYTDISGKAEYFYMMRLEDSKLMNIPFRILDMSIHHNIDDKFDIFGSMGIEYRNRKDSDFMTDSNIEDFLIDLRELYISYYFNNHEIRVGKQLHSWGNVDENSPIDNLNPYDYYYLLLGGSEKKLGIYSLAYDYSFCLDCNSKLSFVYSPMHNASRIPVNDPDYPIGLPAGSSPTSDALVFNDNSPYEYGINVNWSFDFGDISFSHLNLYDRIFNLSGLTVYTDELASFVEPIPRYSYRSTQAFNLGAVLLFDDFTFSFDLAKFNSEDINNLESFESLPNPNYTNSAIDQVFGSPNIMLDALRAFEEKVTYYQTAIQFECPLPEDYNLNMQYFKHEISAYDALDPGLSCDDLSNLPMVSEEDCKSLENDLGMKLSEFNTRNVFMPGVGTPLAMISTEGFLFNISKHFPDKNLTIDLNAFLDAAHGDGKLISIEAEYDIGNGFEVSAGITQIFGDSQIDNYNFNNMKDFSSFRSRITYYF